jgi:hypothetical protein
VDDFVATLSGVTSGSRLLSGHSGGQNLGAETGRSVVHSTLPHISAPTTAFGKTDFHRLAGTLCKEIPDALDNPTRPNYHNPFHPITRVGYARFVGCNWSFYPGVGPILFPQRTTYLPTNSKRVPYSARSGQLPPATPATSYWPQSGSLWRVLLKVLLGP